jgi:hypothetical protein
LLTGPKEPYAVTAGPRHVKFSFSYKNIINKIAYMIEKRWIAAKWTNAIKKFRSKIPSNVFAMN